MESADVLSIEEVRKAKEALEKRLTDTIAEFQDKCGVKITAVEGVRPMRYVDGEAAGRANYVGWVQVAVGL